MTGTSPKVQPATNSLEIVGSNKPEYAEILTSEALDFLATLSDHFSSKLALLLEKRDERQEKIDSGSLPDFLAETKSVRLKDWRIRGIPDELLDRRLEITGPPERKMVINALNANVRVFMADFEDSLSPTWDNLIQGQINLRDANRRQIDFSHPETGKKYILNKDPAILICRVRGLHLTEKHILQNKQRLPGCLVDFALYFFHNFQTLLNRGSQPYFYIPKLQSHLEARWWSEIFHFTEKNYQLPTGTIKATVLIETLPAVFEMDEILYELKDHIVALNCGRWDYIFSYIKTLKAHSDRILPDRQAVTMDKPFLSAYSKLLIRTCHRRGALAMGGMSAFIPSKDPTQNKIVLDKVKQDKHLEASNGHDGTWVAHPGLAESVQEVFSEYLQDDRVNQLDVLREDDEEITACSLLEPPTGEKTEQGMRLNIRIAVQYIAAWLQGNGCVPIYGLMEDAATAEISRASIWQWIQSESRLNDGQLVTKSLFQQFLKEEMAVLEQEIGEAMWQSGQFISAGELLESITTSDDFMDFLTLPAYEAVQ